MNQITCLTSSQCIKPALLIFALFALFCIDVQCTARASLMAETTGIENGLVGFDSQSSAANPVTVNAYVATTPHDPNQFYNVFAEGTTTNNKLLFRFENKAADALGNNIQTTGRVTWDDKLSGSGLFVPIFEVHGEITLFESLAGNPETWNFNVVATDTSGPLDMVTARGISLNPGNGTVFDNLAGWDSFTPNPNGTNPNEFKGQFSLLIPRGDSFSIVVESLLVADTDGAGIADLMNTIQMIAIEDEFGNPLDHVTFESGFTFTTVSEPPLLLIMLLAVTGLTSTLWRRTINPV